MVEGVIHLLLGSLKEVTVSDEMQQPSCTRGTLVVQKLNAQWPCSGSAMHCHAPQLVVVAFFCSHPTCASCTGRRPAAAPTSVAAQTHRLQQRLRRPSPHYRGAVPCTWQHTGAASHRPPTIHQHQHPSLLPTPALSARPPAAPHQPPG